MPIEEHFDIPFVANLALREKQIQQNYRPVIAVHKWFARRPGTLFRALLLAEFASPPLRDSFYQSHNLDRKRIADPFMGGGTPLLEANRLGCDVIGYDINPMAYWIVRQEIEHLELEKYRTAADHLIRALRGDLGALYQTTCTKCASPEAIAKYILWVKTTTCEECKQQLDLFPGYLLAEDKRHPKNVIVCATCRHLNETPSTERPGPCASCRSPLRLEGPASRGKITCPACARLNTFPHPAQGPPRHRMFAIEYHCPHCKPQHTGRFFKAPDQGDLARYAAAENRLAEEMTPFIPNDAIPAGDETNRLHRWGYGHYRDLFNARQLLGLERSCKLIAALQDQTIKRALATNLSDLLRYQNMLCRYDTMALKSLDIFSIHGFPVGLVQCESNLLGIETNRINIGSGGWTNITAKYLKAKAYCDHPFEIKHDNGKRHVIQQPGEWIGDARNAKTRATRSVRLICASATAAKLPPNTLDAVLTDPPYFGNVQYAELMDFCYVWLRRLLGDTEPAFATLSTRHADELTGNQTLERGLAHFTQGLSDVFRAMARALKRDAPFAFTYHHNTLAAYQPIAVAVLDAGLACTAALPCPAEMGASIHINGTGSSVMDTIFVCRKRPAHRLVPREPLDKYVERDRQALRREGIALTAGDERCIRFGHATRSAINALLPKWDESLGIQAKLDAVGAALAEPTSELVRAPAARTRRPVRHASNA